MILDKEKKPIGIWIAWEDHRRSRELSKALEIPYHALISNRSRPLRYIILSFKTITLVNRIKPSLIFCQNPSIVLALLLCLAKSLFKFELVVDRHSNFKFDTKNSRNLKWKIFHIVSDYTIRNSNLTVVTNEPLAKLVSEKGGRAIVLPDKLPDVTSPNRVGNMKKGVNFLFICTFSYDEPVEEVLKAFSALGEGYNLYVTGDYRKLNNWKEYFFDGNNISFLGFVDEISYRRYLNSCDATIVLTSMDLTLNCGSYESVAANKPQIVSDSPVIRRYFKRGAIYVKNFEVECIKHSIVQMKNELYQKGKEQKELEIQLKVEWDTMFYQLKKSILWD